MKQIFRKQNCYKGLHVKKFYCTGNLQEKNSCEPKPPTPNFSNGPFLKFSLTTITQNSSCNPKLGL